ncbi:NAD(P)/FAD-dependent oxidoreductase [Acidisoma sp. C75]
MSGLRIAIIGAGVSGLAAARHLAGAHRVTLFDKGRSPGGRLANRRRAGFAFDFGAQFFTARDPRFLAETARLTAAGAIRPWHCRFAEIERGTVSHWREWGESPAHFVGIGRMTALAAAWAEGLTLHRATRITALRREADGSWRLMAEDGAAFGPFDRVLLALPAPQAAALLPPESPLQARAAAAQMQGCFALMLGFEALPDAGFDAALIKGGVLSWLSMSKARPGHEGGPGLLALTRNDWADAHMEDAPEMVQAAMMQALTAILGRLPRPVHQDLHRWRYANCPSQAEPALLIDAPRGLALCGDWTRHGRVEAAFLSGLETAEAIAAAA